MKKKKSKDKKSKPTTYTTQSPLGSLGRWGKLPYRQLQKEAISLGMPFPDVIEGDLYKLIGYIEKAIENRVSKNSKLVEEYDNWLDSQLKLRGIERAPSLRLSYIEPELAKERNRVKKSKPAKEKKPPREKDKNGLIKGTKKSYTFELVSKGKSTERIIKKVKKRYPDANDKSIIIWIKKAEKEAKK